ncbi:outer membrane protein assembly factor BamA [Candidatus Pelagibacter sp.]|uniref:outer membrane protein assembly factor BamA n=1 Tax=Candidatus Pelagibacter sp. TaxID=2024849 RepID=UPI003D1361D4
MKIKFYKLLNIIILYAFFINSLLYAEVVKDIIIVGNDRISNETIKIFTNVSVEDDLVEDDLNLILKNLYNTNFFKNVSLSLTDNVLSIKVVENPIVENIIFEGIKSNKILEILREDTFIKSRSSYNENLLKKEKERLNFILKNIGYYNSVVNIYVEEKKSNLVDLTIDINLGKKARIKKISFIGNKIFKDNKLRRVIASSEYRFWKFLTGRKYLNEGLVDFDTRLLTNFYKNNGYYNVEINSSFAKLVNNNEFELIFNIDAKSKIFFDDLKLNLPFDFDVNNFNKIEKLFKKIKGEAYSINKIEQILEEINYVTSLEQYQFVNATVDESIVNNKINLTFNVRETEKFYIDKINIYGNNITSENVIRNQLEVDEGDPYNEILINKSINTIKSLNFFKEVNKEVIEDKNTKTKKINIIVDEKPTGEITASAGFGTDGGTLGFGVKENNFLGRGIGLNTNFLLSEESFKGRFTVKNPNFKNSDKSVSFSAEAIEIDNLTTNGYKTNKIGFSIGSNFEYRNDFFLGVGNTNFYEVIDTNSTASARQKAQEGNYWDSFVKLDFDYDKRNQKFQTSSGFKSFYSIDLPVVSETNSLKNYYNYSYYFDLFDKNISNLSFYFETANSINNKEIKLSERIKIPSNRLRGFERGKVGPKDGTDFIGGNYAYSLNFSSTIPQLFAESQNVDFLFFTDVADIWGVDYDSSLDNSKIRSSIGLALDWFSPIGPMNFSIAQPITKANDDKTESFRFNLGTTF